MQRRNIRKNPLASRLADNAACLLVANHAIAQAAAQARHVTPAAQWLLDNYHLVDMQIREIGIDLPPKYYAELPKLAEGPFAGLPRVFSAVWSLVSHTCVRISMMERRSVRMLPRNAGLIRSRRPGR